MSLDVVTYLCLKFCCYIGTCVLSVDSSYVSRLIDDVISDCGNGVDKGSCHCSGIGLGEGSGNVSVSVKIDDSISNCTISHGGSRYCVPICADDIFKPYVDQLFD